MSLIDRKNIDRFKPMLADYLMRHHNILNLKNKFTCLNPEHEDHHPSMNYTNKYDICKCFSCGASYDIFDLIGIDYNVDSFKEKLEIAFQLYPNIDADINDFFYTDTKDIEIVDYSNYYKKCYENIEKTDYLLKRKIDCKLIDKYRIGYDEKKNMIVFPINNNCYFARGIDNNVKTKSRGTSYIWNEDLLKNNDNKIIYVTESIIDSLSLETIDSDVKTIALNGLPNYKRLLKIVKENDYNGCLVLAFDNDKTGLSYQEIVKNELSKIGVRSFSITLISSISDVKDLNEALINNKEKLKSNYIFCNENFKKIMKNEEESEIEL